MCCESWGGGCGVGSGAVKGSEWYGLITAREDVQSLQSLMRAGRLSRSRFRFVCVFWCSSK